VTHYTESAHAELERVLRTTPLDFIQFNDSIAARNAEQRLLPLAAEHGAAVLVNLPFEPAAHARQRRGRFRRLARAAVLERQAGGPAALSLRPCPAR
jgi:aryl-alcohol dehydrogenase-like predicted oxidoreductase